MKSTTIEVVSQTLLFLAAGALFSGPVARACSWSYTLWSIRTKSADPLFRFVRSGKAGYIDPSGKVVIEANLPAEDNFFGEFHEGLLAVKENHGYRYIDPSGRVAFRTDAWLAFDFSEGLASASRYAGFPADKFARWGFIDRTGNFAIAPQYYGVGSFVGGLARVAVSSEFGTTGYIDKRGRFAILPHLTYGSGFQEDRAAVIIGGPCRITNGGSCGRPTFQPTDKQAAYDCRYAFIDKSGAPVSDLRFDDAMDFSEGLAPVRVGDKWGFVDRAGEMSISPGFNYAGQFSEGLATVAEADGKMGFIDHSGNFAIPPQFESAGSFSDGRALVTIRENPSRRTYRFIDKNGNPAFAGEYSDAAPFSHGLAPVALDRTGSLAWIDTSGRVVLSYTGR